MKNKKGKAYSQTTTYKDFEWQANPKYDFIYSKKQINLFTSEQVSVILDKVNDTMKLLNSSKDSIQATQDLIYWLKRDLLDTDK
tara:strand:+ start:5776 stop:6027 length:252 start_codon:yes stop_codon:yes gene_type:complete